jgi:hypothetical protein
MLKRHEVLFNQVQSFREVTLSLVESVNEGLADIVPKGFNNNIRWNLGHIYIDQYLWIQAVTKEKIGLPEGYMDWFGFGTKPADWKTKPPALKELKEQLAKQPQWIMDNYGDRLEEVFPETELGMHTIAQVLVRTIFHEGLHAAAIRDILRFI